MSSPLSPGQQPPPEGRAALMEQHAAARRRRDSAPLGSDEFRAAAEEVARIEIEIARLEEPPAVAPDQPTERAG
jgi:hypothetical protein